MLTKLKIDKNKIAKALNIYIGGGGPSTSFLGQNMEANWDTCVYKYS